MSKLIEIRRAVRRDIRRILDIEAVSFGRDAWEERLFLEALDECGHLFFVARLGGRIAGYSITCIERDRAELISIAVFPEARRHGVGEALIDVTIGTLRRREIGVLRLMVRVGNYGAIRFYRGLGFVRLRRVKDYYGRGRGALRMELRLPAAVDDCVTRTHRPPELPQRT